MGMNEIKRGDVILVDLKEKEGSIQWGQRPVIVVSNNLNNRFSQVISVVPLTTSKFKKNLPTHVGINKDNSRIRQDSIALTEQTMVIPKSYIIKNEPLFSLSEELMNKISIGMMIQLGIVSSTNANRMAFAM